MKKFEKWCDEIEYLCVDYTKRDSMRRGYKQALQWVQSRLKFGSEVAYSEADILMAIKKEIREELEG